MNQQKKKSTKKIILLSSLALIAFGSVGGTLAYWASSVTGNKTDNSQDIIIGPGKEEGTIVTVGGESSITGNKVLVPAAYVNDNANNIDNVKMTFTINWKSINSGATEGTVGTLTSSLVSAVTSFDDNMTYLLNVTFDYPTTEIISDGDAVKVVATITLNEPANATEYQYIAGQTLTLKFNFKVTL